MENWKLESRNAKVRGIMDSDPQIPLIRPEHCYILQKSLVSKSVPRGVVPPLSMCANLCFEPLQQIQIQTNYGVLNAQSVP
jgi:hypothetical protein